MNSQAFYTKNSLAFYTMKPTIPERIARIKAELNIDEDVALAKIAGASKAMVNHWLSGRVKSIAPQYAYRLEEKTGFSAKWIQLGEGEPRTSQAIVHTIVMMQMMEPEKQYLVARLVDQIAEPITNHSGNGT